METNNPNQSANAFETPFDSQITQNTVNSQRGFLPIASGILVILVIVGGFAYYLTPTGTTDNQPTQIPKSEKFTIIVDGKELFIDRNKLQNPDNAVMDIIEYYEIAPDKSKVALLAQGGINSYFLYLSDINGENITYIGFADEIKWSHNSKYLAYTSPVTDIGPHRFNIYEIESKKFKEFEDRQLDNPTKYSNIQWSNDDESLLADYYSYKIPGGEKISSGKKTYRRDQFK